MSKFVYFLETYGNYVVKAEVIKELPNQVFFLKCLSIVDTNDNEIYSFPGTTQRRRKDCFDTIEDLMNYKEKKDKRIINNYCSEITDMNSLLNFPLEHCLFGEEYTDQLAVKAYRIKVKELCNIDL